MPRLILEDGGVIDVTHESDDYSSILEAHGYDSGQGFEIQKTANEIVKDRGIAQRIDDIEDRLDELEDAQS